MQLQIKRYIILIVIAVISVILMSVINGLIFHKVYLTNKEFLTECNEYVGQPYVILYNYSVNMTLLEKIDYSIRRANWMQVNHITSEYIYGDTITCLKQHQ